MRLRSVRGRPPFGEDRVNLRHAFGQRAVGSEDPAVGLHHALHLEPDLGRRARAFGMAELVEAREREVGGNLRQVLLDRAGLHDFGELKAGSAAENDEVDEAIRAEAVGAVHADTSRLADCEQARHDRIGHAVLQGHDLAVIVRRDAAHGVVNRRHDRDWLTRQVDTGEGHRCFGDAWQALGQNLRIDMVEVKEDVVLMLADAAAFADLHRHRARYHVAAGEVLRRRSVALHEALAFAIGEIAPFAPRALGDQNARAINTGRVELDELHVLERKARAEHHCVAITGAGMRRGRAEIDPPIAAGRKHDRLSAEPVDRAVVESQRNHAATDAVLHDQVDREIFDEEVGVVLQALLVERVKHCVAGAVRGRASALGRRAFAHVLGHSAERALVDFALGRAAEGQADMLELDHGGRRLAHIYSIASWSPSQSEPLTVSYMCQVQWSGPMLPRLAAMPPCAATV